VVLILGQKAQNRIQAWLVGIDPFSAFLLMMTLFRAEHACHLVLVGVNHGWSQLLFVLWDSRLPGPGVAEVLVASDC
jgi:hypothetical protein